MISFRFILLALGLLISSSHVYAMEMTPYVGLSTGFYHLKYSQNGAAGTLGMSGTTFGAEVKGGIQFGSYVGLELKVGKTGRISQNFPPGVIGNAWPLNLKVGTDVYISYLLKPQYEVKDRLKLYALLGGTGARFQTSSSSGNYLQHATWKTGFSYGLGVEYMFRMNGSICLEFIQHWSAIQLGAALNTTSQASMRAMTISVNKYF